MMKAFRKDALCFVATFAYQDANHPQVLFLKRFRDECLLETGWGTILVDLYYWVGPKLVSGMQNIGCARAVSRIVLERLIAVIRLVFSK